MKKLNLVLMLFFVMVSSVYAADIMVDGLLKSKGPIYITSDKVSIVTGGCWVISDEGDTPDIVYPDGMPTEIIVLGKGLITYGRRALVRFPHKPHYRFDDNCEVCHHQHPIGDWSCVQCHSTEYNYEDVCHELCANCHRERKNNNLVPYGPTKCKTCHLREYYDDDF